MAWAQPDLSQPRMLWHQGPAAGGGRPLLGWMAGCCLCCLPHKRCAGCCPRCCRRCAGCCWRCWRHVAASGGRHVQRLLGRSTGAPPAQPPAHRWPGSAQRGLQGRPGGAQSVGRGLMFLPREHGTLHSLGSKRLPRRLHRLGEAAPGAPCIRPTAGGGLPAKSAACACSSSTRSAASSARAAASASVVACSLRRVSLSCREDMEGGRYCGGTVKGVRGVASGWGVAAEGCRGMHGYPARHRCPLALVEKTARGAAWPSTPHVVTCLLAQRRHAALPALCRRALPLLCCPLAGQLH